MYLAALSLKRKGTNDIFCISLEWLNNAVFYKEIAAVCNLQKSICCRLI